MATEIRKKTPTPPRPIMWRRGTELNRVAKTVGYVIIITFCFLVFGTCYELISTL